MDWILAMNPTFTLLSALYIFAIFHWADSPTVSQIGVFNPLSLLHIPLYGVLTLLLTLALRAGVGMEKKDRRIAAALIALTVGILDEVHQTWIPNRKGEMVDVLLDGVGIGLAFMFGPPLLIRLMDSIGQKFQD